MWIAAAAVILVLALAWPSPGPRRRGRPLFRHTGPQWRRGYGRRSFLRLGLALGAAAVLVYSGADEAFEQAHTNVFDPREGRLDTERRAVRAAGRDDEADRMRVEDYPPSASDRLALAVEPAGKRFWFGIWGLAGAVDWLWRSSPFSQWGRRSFEAMCVGLPTLWTVQRVLGANRPSSKDGSPRWRPMQHANAASGHAFMAAIPCWTLALMLRPTWARGAMRGLGLLTGWSRINDRKHYLSQVLLGWTIAWNAVDATRAGDEAAAQSATEAP
jgi:hypothetical protein